MYVIRTVFAHDVCTPAPHCLLISSPSLWHTTRAPSGGPPKSSFTQKAEPELRKWGGRPQGSPFPQFWLGLLCKTRFCGPAAGSTCGVHTSCANMNIYIYVIPYTRQKAIRAREKIKTYIK